MRRAKATILRRDFLWALGGGLATLQRAGGPCGAAARAPTSPGAGTRRLLYVGRAPKDRNGFRDLKPSLEVHDIDDGHRLVKVVPLPEGTYNIRGICVSAATRRLYVGHYGTYKDHPDPEVGGKMLCLDLVTEEVLWEKSYRPSVDRQAITPDGRLIYMPAGEERPEDTWTVIDGLTGEVVASVSHAAKAHNTICSLDGKFAFLQAFGNESQRTNDPKTKAPLPDADPADDLSHENGFLTDRERSIAVVDTATQRVVRRVGPFREKTRPFTINGRGTLIFMTVNDLIGFQVADVATGRVLHTGMPPGDAYPQPAPTNNSTFSHGIALSPEERDVWVVDQKNIALHVFDVTGLPARPPAYVQTVKTRSGRPEIFGQPGWLTMTVDGRYLYPETGEIIDAPSRAVVGQLVGADGKPTHSRFMIEVDVRDGVPTQVGDQFGVGRVTR